MDRPSILGSKSAPAAANKSAATRPATSSISAAIAVANSHLAPLSESAHIPSLDEVGHSLAEMAHRDLEAALQLLAERAQYITEATGAAIALRRGDHNDMLCRASAGSSAPELGALLSMEYGLSGESVRTRQTQRCDDAETDPRVNREGCRQLGIVSVVVMPIVSNDQVLGVFQLFSGRPHAFADRDISALRRLSQMVETAVKHAVAAQAVPEPIPQLALQLEEESAHRSTEQPAEESKLATQPESQPVAALAAPAEPVQKIAEPEKPQEPKPTPEIVPKKPLFWSAAVQAQSSAAPTEAPANSTAVPAGLRNLQKCQSCGFPVSQGRTLCVECEEKQWRGQRPSAPGKEAPAASTPVVVVAPGKPPSSAEPLPATSAASAPQAAIPEAVVPEVAAPKVEAISTPSPIPSTSPSAVAPSAPGEMKKDSEASKDEAHKIEKEEDKDNPVLDTSTLFASSAAPSESWLAANKYVLAVLLVVALIVVIIASMR